MGTVAAFNLCIATPSCQFRSAPRIFTFSRMGRPREERWGELEKGKKNNSGKAWIFYFLPDQIPPFQEINLGMR